MKVFFSNNELYNISKEFEIGFMIGIIDNNKDIIILERLNLSYQKNQLKNIKLDKNYEDIKRYLPNKLDIYGIYISNPTEVNFQLNEVKDLLKNITLFLNISEKK